MAKINSIIHEMRYCEDVSDKPSTAEVDGEHKPPIVPPIVNEPEPTVIKPIVVNNADAPIGKVIEVSHNTNKTTKEGDSSDPEWLCPPKMIHSKSKDQIAKDFASDKDNNNDHHSDYIPMRTRAMPIVPPTVTITMAQPTTIVSSLPVLFLPGNNIFPFWC